MRRVTFAESALELEFTMPMFSTVLLKFGQASRLSCAPGPGAAALKIQITLQVMAFRSQITDFEGSIVAQLPLDIQFVLFHIGRVADVIAVD